MEINRKTCFVIMPVNKTDNQREECCAEHFENFLKPLIEENPDFEARRSEAIRRLEAVLTECIRNLKLLDIVTKKSSN